VERFIEKATRLYEQEPHSGALGLYVRRFTQWCIAGFGVVDKPQFIVRLIPYADGKNLLTQLSFLPTHHTESEHASSE